MMEEIISRINEILKLDIDDNAALDISRADMISKIVAKEHSQADIQQAFIHILTDNNRSHDEYDVIAQALYFSVAFEKTWDKEELDKDRLTALINFRLNPFDKPYEDNLAWSLTCDFYDLDYCNSTYNVFRDEKMLNILREYGLIDQFAADTHSLCLSNSSILIPVSSNVSIFFV